MAGESIGSQIGNTGFVHNFVLETHQFSVKLQLPRSVQPLVSYMH